MKNIFKKFGLLTLATSFIFSCSTVDFGDENINPNSPTNMKTDALLTNAITAIPGIVSSPSSNYYTQGMSDITYTTYSRYDRYQWSYDGFYTGPLTDLKEILDLNTSNAADVIAYGDNNNQMAIAHILQVYMYHHMTDRWGAIPYTEALQGAENIAPAFDQQKDVYSSLFVQLDTAIGLINNSAVAVQGDIMFNGDMTSWKRFANTLKMTMALRMSDVDPSNAQSKFLEAVAGGVLTSTSQDVHYPYLDAVAHENPWKGAFRTRNDFAPSKKFIDYLTTNSDPRLFKMADGSKNSGGVTYAGMPYGLEDPSISGADIASITSAIITDGTQHGGFLYTYAQVCLAMSEAALKGWGVAGDAQTWYELGIKASMDQWGVSSADASTYIASVPAVSLKNMAMEKWVALWLQGYEGWAEWRRLDFPNDISAPSAALSGTGIPVRHGYGANTVSNNSANYDAAVSLQGADTQDTKLWWDTK
jgi:hypothetical protein